MWNIVEIFFLPLIMLCCLNATLMPRKLLGEKTKEVFEYAFLFGISDLALTLITFLTVTIPKGTNIELADYLRCVSLLFHPVSLVLLLAKEVPIELVLYNPFYWLFIAFVWLFCISSFLFFVFGVCNSTVLGIKTALWKQSIKLEAHQ